MPLCNSKGLSGDRRGKIYEGHTRYQKEPLRGGCRKSGRPNVRPELDVDTASRGGGNRNAPGTEVHRPQRQRPRLAGQIPTVHAVCQHGTQEGPSGSCLHPGAQPQTRHVHVHQSARPQGLQGPMAGQIRTGKPAARQGPWHCNRHTSRLDRTKAR